MADNSNNFIQPPSEAPEDIDAQAGHSVPENLEDVYLAGLDAENTTQEIYNKRLRYRNNLAMYQDEYSNLVDFNFAEKHLYGRTSRAFVPIVVADAADLVRLKQGAKPEVSYQVLNFVEENFTEMSYQFKKAVMSQQIDDKDKYLSELLVYKAYEDPQRVYVEHLKVYKHSINSIFREKDLSIIDFDDFIAKLMPYLYRTARKHPFTFPAFVKSNYCPAYSSGLVIEIADLKPAADLDKILKITHSRNWEYYLNACRSYGFMVDKFYPWRLVADIASAPMLRKAANYGRGDTNKILRTSYIPAHRRFYTDFKNIMYRFYNEVKYPSYEAVKCDTGRVRIKANKPLEYTPQSLRERYGDMFFFSLYCSIRFFEEESKFTEPEKRKLIDKCVQLARQNEMIGVDTFEQILNKTFDYVGSLSYIKKKFDRIDRESRDNVLPNY